MAEMSHWVSLVLAQASKIQSGWMCKGKGINRKIIIRRVCTRFHSAKLLQSIV
jgi:hypothetical protein